MFYVAMEIGCIECGEDSVLLGIFTERSRADDALLSRQASGKGYHSDEYQVFEVPKLNEAYEILARED